MTDTHKRDRVFNLIALFIYALAVILITAHHEPWRDEADVWLIAANNTPMSLPHILRYAGSPGLFHLLLMPLAKAGLPYPGTILLLNNLIAIAAAGVVLFLAPFPRLTRTLIVFSSYFAFEYAVIARPYALTVLLTTIACALYPHRTRRPILLGVIIALLLNSTVHGAILAGAFLLLLLIERNTAREIRIALLIAAAGFLLAAAQLYPPIDGQESFKLTEPNWVMLTIALRSTAIQAGLETQLWLRHAGVALGALALLATIAMIRPSRSALLFTISALIGFAILFVCIYYGSVWHAGMISLALLAAAWIARSETKPVNRPAAIALHVVLIASCAFTAVNWFREWTMRFSDAQNVAAFLNEHHLADRTIAAFPDPHASAVKAFLPNTPIWYAGMQSFGTHMHWDAAYMTARKLPYEDAMVRIMQQFRDNPDMLLLLNRPMESPLFREIYRTSGPNYRDNGERYCLYERATTP